MQEAIYNELKVRGTTVMSLSDLKTKLSEHACPEYIILDTKAWADTRSDRSLSEFIDPVTKIATLETGHFGNILGVEIHVFRNFEHYGMIIPHEPKQG